MFQEKVSSYNFLMPKVWVFSFDPFQKPGRMEYRQNTHTSCLFTGINDSVIAFDDLSDAGVTDFRYNSSTVRVIANELFTI